MTKLVREVGNWVSGERFWDRQAEIRELTSLLEEGANILLVAPRRVGKTSLMHEVASRLEDHYTTLYVDLQKSHDPVDAIVELSLATHAHQSLWQKTKQRFRNILDNPRLACNSATSRSNSASDSPVTGGPKVNTY